MLGAPTTPRVLRGVLAICLLGLLLLGPYMAVTGVNYTHLLEDYKGGLWDAGHAILNGISPYVPRFLAHQAHILRLGGTAVGETGHQLLSVPVYPAPVNLLMAAVALPPYWLSAGVYTMMSIAAMGLAVWFMGVRDPRCYLAVAVSWPFLYCICLGEVGCFVAFGFAVAWAYRDRTWPTAVAVASTVALKIFPWTAAVWLLVTRRYRTCAYSVLLCAVTVFGAWAIIGFDGLAEYPRMLSNLTLIQEHRSDSLASVVTIARASSTAATAVCLTLAAAILLLAWRLADGERGDERAFGLCVLAALAGSPLVWDHYMVLLFLPVALASPRFSLAWVIPGVVPALVWLSPHVVPYSLNHGAYSPNQLRATIAWLIVELGVTGYLLFRTRTAGIRLAT
jgi:hypothetical protein